MSRTIPLLLRRDTHLIIEKLERCPTLKSLTVSAGLVIPFSIVGWTGGLYDFDVLIFELPSERDIFGLRVASIGSCRVYGPLVTLRDRGDIRLCATGLSPTHTASEALQSLNLVTGDLSVPHGLARFIFNTEESPPVDQLRDTLLDGIDTFILEISDGKQFFYRDICLQQNFLTNNLIRPHRGALLDWYRKICLGQVVDEACIQSSLENLREGGFAHGEEMADLLRHIHLVTESVERTANALTAMMAKTGGRWIVVGAFEVPGHDGAIMNDRRALNQKLSSVAAGCGALFYDPTGLVVRHGKEVALDGGSNINEYAQTFYPVVGETLVSLARTGRPPDDACAVEVSGGQEAKSAASRSLERVRLAERLNKALVALHRDRLDKLGPAASGLYVHYERLVALDSLVGPRERATHHMIDTHIPAYDHYLVFRAGLGELALLLAVSGRRVTAFEPHASRRAAIEAGAANLEAAGLLAPGLFDIMADLTPEPSPGLTTLGVGLNAVIHDPDQAARLLERASDFEALLIDPRLFLQRREDRAEHGALADDLRQSGFDQQKQYRAEGLAWFYKSRAPPGAGDERQRHQPGPCARNRRGHTAERRPD